MEKPPYRPGDWCLLATLFVVPVLVIAGRWAGAPGLDGLSLERLPAEVQRQLGHVLFLPLGALVVVFVRLTLGLRLLGPFRSLLLALAFQATGVLLGLAFMVLVIAVMLGLGPLIQRFHVPFFGRVSLVLSLIAAMVILVLLLGRTLQSEPLYSVASFPLVVLCLTAEGFARVLRREGARQALWRGGVTAMAAVILTGLAAVPGVRSLLLRYPELVLAQVGLIVLIARFLALRAFEYLNPGPEKQKQKRKRRGRRKKRKLADAGSAALLPQTPAPKLPLAEVTHENRSSTESK